MKFFIKTFGCRVNQVESQALLENFSRRGWEQTSHFEQADLCLLNTCTVTHQADKDVEKHYEEYIKVNELWDKLKKDIFRYLYSVTSFQYCGYTSGDQTHAIPSGAIHMYFLPSVKVILSSL